MMARCSSSNRSVTHSRVLCLSLFGTISTISPIQAFQVSSFTSSSPNTNPFLNTRIEHSSSFPPRISRNSNRFSLCESPSIRELDVLLPSLTDPVFVGAESSTLLPLSPPTNDTIAPVAVSLYPSPVEVASPQPPSTLVNGQLLVMIAAALYGTNFPCVKLLDQMMPSALSAAMRFSLAGVVVGAVVLLSEKKSISTPKLEQDRLESMLRGMEVGAWYAVGYITQALALQTVEAGKCAFFNALAVIIVPLLDAMFKQVSPSVRTIGAVVLAISGVGIIELGGASTATNGFEMGTVLSAIMSLSFAVGYWRLESATKDYPLQSSRITWGQLAAVAIGAVVYAAIALPSFWSEPYYGDLIQRWLADPFILGALLWTGLASTALAIYLETRALLTITASELTVLMTSTSLWAAAFAYMTLGEVMSPVSLGGGLLILTGCLVSAKGNAEADEGDIIVR